MINNLPSVKTLAQIMSRYCRIEANEGARIARRILETRSREALETMLDSGEYPVTRSWYFACYHPLPLQTVKLSMVSELTHGYGVEYIPAGRGAKSPSIEYVNHGDTYAATLMWTRGRYIVGDWGSIVERGNYD